MAVMDETWSDARKVWDEAVGAYEWLKSLTLGEFAEARPSSVVVTDMLLAMTVPGVVIVTSARDLAAVCLRLGKRYEGTASAQEMAQHPEWQERAILIACALGVFGPVISTAVGGLIGLLVGDEAAAVLRGLCLLLITESGAALEKLVGFLARFTKGNIVTLLKKIRFADYADMLVAKLRDFITKMGGLIARVKAQLSRLEYFERARRLLAELERMEKQFHAVQARVAQEIPRALAQLDEALQRVLRQQMPIVRHTAYAGVPAVKPAVTAMTKTRVSSGIGEPPYVMQSAHLDEPGAGAVQGGGSAVKEMPSSPTDEPVGANVHRVGEDSALPRRMMTSAEKGIYGERVSDNFMTSLGYTSMLTPERQMRLLQDEPIGRGIDGVYEVPPAKQPPEYVITEAKYREGRKVPDKDLSMTKGSGKQMGDEWALGKRLEDAVGDEKAALIRDSKKVES